MSNEATEKSYFVGKLVQAASARYESCMTTPPDRYTEDTLVADMLGAHKFAKSDTDRAVLKETEGLGTSRTRAATIDGLIKGGFLESTKKKKRFELRSSQMARLITAQLPEVLTSVATTAKWEVAFGMIEKGKAEPAQVREKLKQILDYIVQTAKATGSIKTGEAVARSPGGTSSAPGGRFSGMGKSTGVAQQGGAAPSASGGRAGTGGSKWFD